MEPTTNEPPAWRPSDPDSRKWSDEEITAGLNTLPIPECTLRVHRANRHDRTSEMQAVTLMCGGALSYEAITQIAGLFETPHIWFAPESVPDPDSAVHDAGMGFGMVPAIEIVVRWEALPPVAKRGGVEVQR